MTQTLQNEEILSYRHVVAPCEFVCPLTMEVFTDPLLSKYGHNFERNAILEWLAQGNAGCPITRQTLTPSMLFPNVSLRLMVRSWQRENNLEVSCAGLETEGSYVGGDKLVVSLSSLNREKGEARGPIIYPQSEEAMQRLRQQAQRRLAQNSNNRRFNIVSAIGTAAGQRHA
jgi:hypothetical protein